MITAYNITDMDFMGYSVDRSNANFHHLIIPRRNGGPKTVSNGAILNKDTSHPYLHVVEGKDYELFYLITREMINENKLGRLDINSIKKIYNYLEIFEREHSADVNFNGEPLIREEYTKRLLK
jgi:hypothetical protein